MGLFSRKKRSTDQSLSVVEPIVMDMPTVKPSELEDMIHVVYKEKLEREAEVARLKAELERAEVQDTKRKAAEEFSRQTEKERKHLERKTEDQDLQIKDFKDKVSRAESQVTTRDIKIRDLEKQIDKLNGELSKSDKQRERFIQKRCVAQLKQRVEQTSGNWSKAKVLDLLEDFLSQDPSYECVEETCCEFFPAEE